MDIESLQTYGVLMAAEPSAGEIPTVVHSLKELSYPKHGKEDSQI
jgi:hypothetical protein